MLKVLNHNIILPKYLEMVKQKGSSLSLPAHGWVGARATSFLAAHFAKQNTNSVGVKSEGEATTLKNAEIVNWRRERDERLLGAKSDEHLHGLRPSRVRIPLLYFIFLYCIYCVLTGGERGIRTLGTSIRIYIRLAGERLRPARPSLH